MDPWRDFITTGKHKIEPKPTMPAELNPKFLIYRELTSTEDCCLGSQVTVTCVHFERSTDLNRYFFHPWKIRAKLPRVQKIAPKKKKKKFKKMLRTSLYIKLN